MNLLGRILKPGILRTVKQNSGFQKIRAAILNSRGNLDNIFPSDFTENEKEDIGFVQPFTMTSLERMIGLSRAVDWLVSNRTEGDIVECGVWKGGSMMLIANRLLKGGENIKKLYLFDTFEGMSTPGSEDTSAINQETAKELLDKSNKLEGDNIWCYSSLEEVKSNLQKTNYPRNKSII